MQKHTLPPNGHIGLTQRCWANIRRCIRCCRQDTNKLDLCIKKCIESQRKGNFTRKTWQQINDDDNVMSM
ncbi:hypothetical protein HRM2_p00120 (plasmid) [Desulforapulum autotrophicum HRM2]|uniref:Uncharacterized protein n=1 Tax=Desulforapulum autotrophicum (strain ATCC 43914 / DSM 3382 / VKM B-1955 / HRM2) TaxID=177437 RepID=C0QML2_DESAH|nr:hypothetical protein HRM2_p00120 [Desulforapulum autotrophicum HRM2]